MGKIFTIFFAIIILLAGCSTEPPVEVSTQATQFVNGVWTLAHEGTITLSDASEIRSPLSGNLVEKFVADGEYVEAGQLLMQVSEQELQARLLKAKAALIKAKTDSARALANQADNAAELQFQLEDAETLVRTLEAEISSGLIYAPKSGRLGAVDAPLGMQVTANETLLATVGNEDPLAVRFEVSPTEARLLTAADDLKITLKFQDGTVYPQTGQLTFLDDTTAEADFYNYEGLLRLGMNVKIEFGGFKVTNALLVPEKAIQRQDGAIFVFVDSNKKAAVRTIVLGDKIGTYYIVKDGLTAGEQVVVDGAENLREGVGIRIKE